MQFECSSFGKALNQTNNEFKGDKDENENSQMSAKIHKFEETSQI